MGEFYYKVAPGSELHQKLHDLGEKIDMVRSKARKQAKAFGGTDFCSNRQAVEGGIDAVYFPHGTPEPDRKLWKKVGESYQRFYYPKAKSKEELGKIAELPVVSFDEMNSIIKFKDGFGGHPNGLAHYKCYGLADGKDGSFLIAIPDEIKYKPIKGMEEIKTSEYKALEVEYEKEG